MNRYRPKVKLLIVDMDNTLYDWVGYFVPAFDAMILEASRILQVPEAALLLDLRDVHRRWRTTDMPFALLESAIVNDTFPDLPRDEKYKRLLPAFVAFDNEKRAMLTLYDGVSETLSQVRALQCKIIGHTEAAAHSIRSRARILRLDRFIREIYATAPRGEGHPRGPERAHAAARDSYHDYNEINLVIVDESERKPNPDLVRHILTDYETTPEECLYVGDSIRNDVTMALEAGVMAAWASYGARHDQAQYSRLLDITHWSTTSTVSIEPDSSQFVTLRHFGDLLDRYEFGE